MWKIAITLFMAALLLTTASAQGDEYEMQIFVDATELPRKLLHSRITLELPDEGVLVYPKWWLGQHGPVGAVGNIAGLTVSDRDGDVVQWKRDWSDVYRFWVDAKTSEGSIEVALTYVCSQPTANTEGCDSYGFTALGIINWNTIALYPEGLPVRDITARLKLVLPKGWQYGTALPFEQSRGDTLVFKPVTLEELLDMPLICGKHFSTVKFATTESAEYYLHIAADDEECLPKNDVTYSAMKRLAEETEALFGRTHFEDYHFLLAVSEYVPLIGMEHRNSSLNSVKANAFADPEKHDTNFRYVVSHELVHAWVGKYRRPTGMNTPDYQVDKNMDLLWVYEGLTEHLGLVLATRAGLSTKEDFIAENAFFWGRCFNMKGRRWRSLRDTQIAHYTPQGRPTSWGFLRRSHDYYTEGAMIWLEFDARIREATQGRRNLDDFCSRLFGAGDPAAHLVPFDLDDLVAILGELADEPWAALIDEKTNSTEEKFSTEGIRLCGYQFDVTDKKSAMQKKWEDLWYEHRDFNRSIGLAVDEEGVIKEVVPDGPAETAGLYDGVKVVGVNGKTFNYTRFENAVRNTTETGKLTLLILETDTYREYEIDYDGGLRYDTLVPVDGKRDWLTEILSPRVEKE